VPSDKRELLLVIRGKDQGAKKALDDLGDSAEGTEDDLTNMRAGLKKLDAQMDTSRKSAAALRAEINRTGDLGLIKDLEKANRDIRRFEKQRKLLIGDDDGRESAREFSLGFAQRIGPLMAKAPLGPGLLGAVAAAVPIVAPAVANGIALGAAGGAVALGAVIAGKDPRVRRALDDLKSEIGDSLRASAAPFSPAMIEQIDKVEDRFQDLRPDLDAIFLKASKYLDPLVDGALGFAEKALPGFRKLVDAAEPLVDVLGEELPELGEDFAAVLQDVASAARDGGDELRVMLDTMGLLVASSGGLLPIFTKTNGALEIYNAEVEKSRGLIPNATWIDPIKGLATAWQLAAKETADAAQATRDYADANRTLTDQNLSVAESTLRYREALVASTDAVDKKKKVSLQEESALLGQARASNTLIESLDRQGASAEVLGQRHRESRQQLVDTAVKMGYAKDRAEVLADQYLQTPRLVNTLFTADTDQAARNLRALRELYASIRSKTVTITVDRKGHQSTRTGGRVVPIGDLGGVAEGGYIDGPGPKGVDSEPRLLAPGEFVLRSSAVDRIGRPALEALNSGRNVRSWMAASNYSGGNPAPQVNVTITTAPGVDHAIADLVNRIIRVRVAGAGSGSVQRAYG
jgi:hypothetical protein